MWYCGREGIKKYIGMYKIYINKTKKGGIQYEAGFWNE